MSDLKFVVCRRASDSLSPTARRGYFCALCDLPLQVTEEGRAHIAKGGKPICNPCGAALSKMPDTDVSTTAVAEANLKSEFEGLDARQALDLVAKLRPR